jgi:hypothetical protein
MSVINFFGPFMRMCMPSGTSTLPGSCSVRGPAVKIMPLVHPGIDTRAESFGTGLVSCATSDPLNTATATARTIVLISAPD